MSQCIIEREFHLWILGESHIWNSIKCSLETVAKGVKSQKLSKSLVASPKSHSRSSSHDSYFEKGANRVATTAPSSNDNAVKFGEEGIDDEDEELDIR